MAYGLRHIRKCVFRIIRMNYCKHAYFCLGGGGGGGGILRKMLARHFTWRLFSRYYSYFLHKGLWVLFSCRGNFRDKDESVKNVKITPTQKFPSLQYSKNPYSTCSIIWNAIPLQIKTASTFQTFKTNVSWHIISKQWLLNCMYKHLCMYWIVVYYIYTICVHRYIVIYYLWDLLLLLLF